MKTLSKLFENNKRWSSSILVDDPQFFKRLSKQQSPAYLWIGCSDSRVPANQITGLDPGEIFVHRNVGNLVIHTDLNCLSVIQYAVEILKVKDIIVCGHYGCGGINTAMESKGVGLIDNWVRNIKDIYHQNISELGKIKDKQKLSDRLCELTVVQQVLNVSHTTIVQNAWNNKVELNVHGWVYGLKDGLIKDLGVGIGSLDQLHKIFRLTEIP
jgi:carbonic anhydrase